MASDQDEIDQIMNEIEELQQEMTAKGEPIPAAPTAQEDDRSLNEFVTVEEAAEPAISKAAPQLASVEAPMAELTAADPTSEESWVEETIADLRREEEASRESAHVTPSTGRVTLGVTPGVGVCLKQESSGQELVIEFESDCVRITTSDGAELKLPVLSRSQGLRRVA